MPIGRFCPPCSTLQQRVPSDDMVRLHGLAPEEVEAGRLRFDRLRAMDEPTPRELDVLRSDFERRLEQLRERATASDARASALATALAETNQRLVNLEVTVARHFALLTGLHGLLSERVGVLQDQLGWRR